ncbi:hypothetical protein B4U80_06540 [Leptotrombidium deliense]|uniref:Uncharacterized protein n=1 Tax=Leptotrombidium deliense TaxID=299467 RepID=A0A443RSQ7_9ACAR|nr:hypothetical protein B4U80_06540 [Leptotrombidium deliense]
MTECFKRESSRLRSFKYPVKYPHSEPSIESLANAGFYYFGESDRVRCAFCNGVLGLWDSHDDPLFEHARCFPQCTFVKGNFCANIPINNDPFLKPRIPELSNNKTKLRMYLYKTKTSFEFEFCQDYKTSKFVFKK